MADTNEVKLTFDLDGDNESAEWIVTYADLVTLLLVFFVLLYSISSLNIARFKRIAESIKASLGEFSYTGGVLDIVELVDSQPEKVRLDDMTGLRSRTEEIYDEIKEYINQAGLGADVEVTQVGQKIIIRMRGTVLFESGSAELNQVAIPILHKLSGVLQEYGEYNVNIKGHTDNIPIATQQFPSNWELSAIRATTVLRFMIDDHIEPARLTATGYGDHVPLVPNTSAENRARNRRVEFVLEKQSVK